MENSLLNYMNKRIGDHVKELQQKPKVPGPVITISREVGCGGLKLARMLSDALNEFVFCKKWQVISKEVLHESARELKVDPQKVNRLFSPNERYTFDEILDAFNAKNYKSDRVILRTVKDVIKGFAHDGCSIIVGRAGHIIANDVEYSLHVRLEAPMEWRIERIIEKQKVSHDEAYNFIIETEKKRGTFRKYYLNKKEEEPKFDLVINVSKFSEENTIQMIKKAVELKGITKKFSSSIPFF